MPKTLVLTHTSRVFINLETRMIATKRMVSHVMAAEDAVANVVLSFCSSLRPTIDVARKFISIPVIKIDDPMTEKAARVASKIGVVATVATTLGPTVSFIKEKANALNKELEIHESLSDAAFQTLMSGDRENHDEMVLEAARALADKVELIVLAQASMTRLAPTIADATGLRVLSSWLLSTLKGCSIASIEHQSGINPFLLRPPCLHKSL